jgi:hypothetical protein
MRYVAGLIALAAPFMAGPEAFATHGRMSVKDARNYTRYVFENRVAYGEQFATRTKCKVRNSKRASCTLTATGGDTGYVVWGSVFYESDAGRLDEGYFFDLRYRKYDEYCYFVLRRPRSKCVDSGRWRDLPRTKKIDGER